MTPVQAVILAVVQGVTEFLPISSSGHLILVPYFLGWRDQGLAFDIATNTGTLLAIVAYFHRDLRDLIAGFFTGRAASREGEFAPRPMALYLVLGTIPAGLAGLLFHDWIATQARNPLLIAGTTLFYGLLLFYADRIGRKTRLLGDVFWRDALVIGIAQALALVPGTSRSGITITAALLLGLSRPAAARFAFLLSVPVSVLVALKDVKDLVENPAGTDELAMMGIGLIVSAIVGYAVIAWLLAWLRRRSLTAFVVYRVLLAAVILVTFAIRG
ncbi:MAG TPA: undecaprenyl-diphosphate phosphatase [Thermoanaerobaculia bacterium]|nr:undecaprenyl-diphosphate phosphatase [Thermoanaerobaculia bacterium]